MSARMAFGGGDEDDDTPGHGRLRNVLELVWGEGWSLPGGPGRIDRLVGGLDLRNASVLDVACRLGGADFYLIEKHQAACVTGVDEDAEDLAAARQKAAALGLADRLAFEALAPSGALPFADAKFDLVCSADDPADRLANDAFARAIYRVLPSGGTVAISALVAATDAESTSGLPTADRYRRALGDAGFTEILPNDQTAWYAAVARNELVTLQGSIHDLVVKHFGQAVADRTIATWETMVAQLDRGRRRLVNVSANKP